MAEYFALVDAEGTGHIRGDQIEVLLRALGFAPTKAEIDCAYTVSFRPSRVLM